MKPESRDTTLAALCAAAAVAEVSPPPPLPPEAVWLRERGLGGAGGGSGAGEGAAAPAPAPLAESEDVRLLTEQTEDLRELRGEPRQGEPGAELPSRQASPPPRRSPITCRTRPWVRC